MKDDKNIKAIIIMQWERRSAKDRLTENDILNFHSHLLQDSKHLLDALNTSADTYQYLKTFLKYSTEF